MKLILEILTFLWLILASAWDTVSRPVTATRRKTYEPHTYTAEEGLAALAESLAVEQRKLPGRDAHL
jgi:hypothetical protein